MPVGIDYEPEAVDDAQLVEDRREVVAHGNFAEVQAFGDLPVLESFADEAIMVRARAA